MAINWLLIFFISLILHTTYYIPIQKLTAPEEATEMVEDWLTSEMEKIVTEVEAEAAPVIWVKEISLLAPLAKLEVA